MPEDLISLISDISVSEGSVNREKRKLPVNSPPYPPLFEREGENTDIPGAPYLRKRWGIIEQYPGLCNNLKMREVIKLAARDLRKNQTAGESILWKCLRNRGFLGKKFLRQFPIIYEIERIQRFFIADFYCHECKLVIEVDGKIHLKQRNYDLYRDMIIRELGFKVIRVSDSEIIENVEIFLSEKLKPLLV
jgi:very-short-patch-repair endonuclease